jgi:hypothetical protein
MSREMEVEILDGENRMECDECKKKKLNGESLHVDNAQSDLSKSFKRYLLFSTPPILVFHLKRFQSLRFFKTRKVDTFVEFDDRKHTDYCV